MRWKAFLLALALVVGACSDDVSHDDEAACERWDAIQHTEVVDLRSDMMSEIGDIATKGVIRARAFALAVALDGDVTQAEIETAYEAMDAACATL